MILDWKLLEESEGKKESPSEGGQKKEKEEKEGTSDVIKKELKGAKILLTAAPKKLVEKYMEIFKQAGLELLSLETEAFAFIRSLVGADRSPLIILDSGAGRTSISIVDKGIPYLNRSIDVGGAVITRTLSQKLHLDIWKAEQFKLDMAQGFEMEDSNILDIISSTINPIINEVRYSLNIYRGQEGAAAKPIEKIVVTGGGAMLAHFADYISKALDMRVYIGDPWSRVIYPEDLKPVLDDLGPRFAVAIGLAMRDIE